MIYVVATIEVVAGKLEEFLAVQRPLLALVRAEAGCIEYVPTVEVAVEGAKSPPRGNIVVMQEKWETLEHLKAHSVAPHMGEFRVKSKGLVSSVRVDVYKPA